MARVARSEFYSAEGKKHRRYNVYNSLMGWRKSEFKSNINKTSYTSARNGSTPLIKGPNTKRPIDTPTPSVNSSSGKKYGIKAGGSPMKITTQAARDKAKESKQKAKASKSAESNKKTKSAAKSASTASIGNNKKTKSAAKSVASAVSAAKKKAKTTKANSNKKHKNGSKTK